MFDMKKHILYQIPMEEVRELYINQLMSLKDLSKRFGTYPQELRKRMIEEGIPMRNNSQAMKILYDNIRASQSYFPMTQAKERPPEDVMYEYYVNQRLSLKKIAHIFGVSHTFIQNILIEYGIERRERCEIHDNGTWGVGFRTYYLRYQNNAKIRNYSFELTEEQFFKLIKGNCSYCGSPPRKRKNMVSNGIDRADNTLGYTVDNCRSCCGQCNMCKRTLSEQEFLDWLQRVFLHQQYQNGNIVKSEDRK